MMGEIPIVSKKDVKGNVVLIRVDHNVVKNGMVEDPYRIERTKPTIDFIIDNGGYPILMTHIGRPRDKKGNIAISNNESVDPIVGYINENWGYKAKVVPVDLSKATERGLPSLDDSINAALKELKTGKVQILYLPNIRWFSGEEEKEGQVRDRFTEQLASIANIFVNDAFGSPHPHVSTYWVTKELPSFAGFLMRDEIKKLQYLLNLPGKEHPFLAIVAGEKIDTKIGALESLRDLADNLLVGGLPANALICAKYNVKINGIGETETRIAKDLLDKDKTENKLLIPDLVMVSDIECNKEKQRQEGTYRELDLSTIKEGKNLGYVYDVSPNYFKKPEVVNAINRAKTGFINAVVGFDKAGFKEGTLVLYQLLDKSTARLYFGGGDTLTALKKYIPDFYKKLIENPVKHTLFTGGGTILDGFESRGVENMKVINTLIENGGKKPA